MARELFLVPMVDSLSWTGAPGHKRAKYTDDAAVVSQGTIRYSRTSNGIVMIQASQAYLNNVAAQPDATSLATASNIDNVLTANQANAAKVIFEDTFIPGQFINAGDTRREVIRGVVGMFLFSQRMEGRFGEGWVERAKNRGVTLNTVWSDFPAALKDEFRDIRDDHGWTNAQLGVTASSTMRVILRSVSDRFEQTPIIFAGYEV